MKTRLFLLGLCVLALASCSIDGTTSVNDTNAISFKTTTATRATAATTNNIDAFTVWAWNTVGTTTSEFMRGVKADKSGSVFITTPTYYWPGGTLDFYAFIPAATVETENSTDYNAHFGEEVDLTGDVIETANGSAYDTYTGYVANAAITDPSAISFDMHAPADAAKGIDLCYAVTLGQSSGTVGLNFRHALSQVAFKAMNGNADWTVDIQGVTLCGIHKDGTCTLPVFDEDGTTEHNSATSTKLGWSVGNSVKGRFNAGIAPTTINGASSASVSITAENGALMLIPQTVAAWEPGSDPTNTEVGAYIRINCKVTDEATGEQIWPNYNEADSTGESPEYAEITVPFDVDWEEGNLYTYTIVFGEGLGYYAPDDPNTDLDGTPVLIPIRFTVDIDDFGNTNGVDVGTDTGDGGDDEGGYDPASLVLEYTVTSDGTEISLPLGEIDNYGNEYAIDCTVDWGDGVEVETVTGSFPSHTYSEAGTYTVIINGKAELLNSWDYNNKRSIDGVECLTAVKQWGDTGLQSMDAAFRGCTNLASLPEGFGPFSAVKSFYYAFAYCSSLTTVPEDIFSDCAVAEDFGWVFGYSGLVSVPSFKGLSYVTNFYCAFFNCSSLTTVPEDMFSGCTAAENFEYVFASCSKLTSAPSFKGLPYVTSFSDAFYFCEYLTSVPEDMFSGCTAVKNFSYVFDSCTRLTSAPSFKGLSNVTIFCYAFDYCVSLASVPEDMFSDCTAVQDFGCIFYGCSSLESVPVGLFDDSKLVLYFDDSFRSCSKLKGESPYTEINVDGTPVKVHLYERENYPEYFTAPTVYTRCFRSCTGLDDYDDIPSGWK